MRRYALLIAAAYLTGFAAVSFAQTTTFTPRDESPEEFAAGPGRDETFYTCTACHNFKLVAQQGMNRRQWNEIIDVMNEKHGMPKLDAKERGVRFQFRNWEFAQLHGAPRARHYSRHAFGGLAQIKLLQASS